ncbi:hypothetical protein LCGC14_3043750, partial [marine sediment metagenome]
MLCNRVNGKSQFRDYRGDAVMRFNRIYLAIIGIAFFGYTNLLGQETKPPKGISETVLATVDHKMY